MKKVDIKTKGKMRTIGRIFTLFQPSDHNLSPFVYLFSLFFRNLHSLFCYAFIYVYNKTKTSSSVRFIKWKEHSKFVDCRMTFLQDKRTKAKLK